MNVPNSLTIARIFFVPLLVAALVGKSVAVTTVGGFVITNEWLALAIFLAAAATDLLDGFLARRWGQITTIGTLLDPSPTSCSSPRRSSRWCRCMRLRPGWSC